MKYLLKTEVNENGNKVFSKMRQGKGYIYLAKDENGNIGQVDKNWILNHKDYIVNLGVSGDSIYPVDTTNEKRNNKVILLNPIEMSVWNFTLNYEDEDGETVSPSYVPTLVGNHDVEIGDTYYYVIQAAIDCMVDYDKLDKIYNIILRDRNSVVVKERAFTNKEKTTDYIKAVSCGISYYYNSRCTNFYAEFAESMYDLDWNESDNVGKKTTKEEVINHLDIELEQKFSNNGYMSSVFGANYEEESKTKVTDLLYYVKEDIEKCTWSTSQVIKNYGININEIIEIIDEAKESKIEQ